ncbi:MAG: hypothetical protein H7Z76_08435 [Methylotenera sp.]|nr:hypothetical protein [Flavobacterium sp.]
MTREEERQILRQNMNHYLWIKPRAQWTEQDLINLEGKSIIGTPKQEVVYDRPRTRKSYKQPVTVIKDGEEKIYESVVLCAAELELEPNTIYAKLNGHQKNNGDYQFFKSKINQ